MAVMSLGVKCGQTVQIAVEGPDEEDAAAGIQLSLRQICKNKR